ncbi:ATP synthase delta chain, chloroplastic [Typha angustifolia]|uniref:ATP synthase delta chain, chloroplastic n=1 Tax=Typha angustifolia TaxID=59011 RepID=UPI003C2FD102
MASLRLSPLSILPKSSSPSSISFSLRRLPSLKLRPRRRARGGATMMDTAASRYASALADVCKSNGTLETTISDLEKIDNVFADKSVQSFFANPTITPQQKLELIDEIGKSSELQPHVVNFLNILVDTRRIDVVTEIVKEFEQCYNRMTGTEVATVTSVVKLESQDLVQIAQAVQRLTGAKNVRIKTVIDPSLIAGFTIRYGNSGSKLVDMSVKKQLDEIASQLDFSSIALV